MKLIYKDMGHILCFTTGCVNELVVENKPLFLQMVASLCEQSEGAQGGFLLSLRDAPVEFSKYADITHQFAPFEVNRKTLLTKLCARLEQVALSPENYMKTSELLCAWERHIATLADDLPFNVRCQRVALSPIVRALSPEIEEKEASVLEKVLDYMALVRELDRERLFVMVNMRTYFNDEEMTSFCESVCLHDFKVLLLESSAGTVLSHTTRYVIDEDLCEF